MGTISINSAAANTIKTQLSTNALKGAMKSAYEVNAKGVRPINEVLAETFGLMGDLSAKYSALASITTTGEEDESVANLAGWRANPSSYNSTVTGNPLTETEIILYSMDVERILLNHMLSVMSTLKGFTPTDKAEKAKIHKFRKRAKECAQDLIVNIAMGYKNLCHRLNPVSGPDVLDPTVNGAVDNILKLSPDNRTCFDVVGEIAKDSDFKNLVKDKVIQNVSGAVTLASELSEADRKAKKTAKKSKRNPVVGVKNAHNALFAKKLGGDTYKDLYGVEADGVIKAGIIGAASVAVVVGGILILNNCSGNEQETETTTASETTVAEPETEGKINYAEETEAPQAGETEDPDLAGDGGEHVYDDPADERGDNEAHTGGSFTNPWVAGDVVEEEEEIEEEVVEETIEPTEGNLAEGLGDDSQPAEENNEDEEDMGWGRA